MNLLGWADVIAMIFAAGCVGIFAMFVRNIWSPRPHQPAGRATAYADGAGGWSGGSAVCTSADGGGCSSGGDGGGGGDC